MTTPQPDPARIVVRQAASTPTGAVLGNIASSRSPGGTPWRERSDHRAWLASRWADMLGFAVPSAVATGGFAWLDAGGQPIPGRGPSLLFTGRMAHVAALGTVRGIPGTPELMDHAVHSLLEQYRGPQGVGFGEPGTARLAAYDHVQIALAAASVTVAGHSRAAELFDAVVSVVNDLLWREQEGALIESCAADGSDVEEYRGGNANMHGVEAFLALADVTGDPRWRSRAVRIADRLVNQEARQHGWLIPEHYDDAWNPLPDYNRDQPEDPFRPFGATLGHSLEWARLLCAIHASPPEGEGAEWAIDAAANLATTALSLWNIDGEGLPYTVDWEGRTASGLRLHWPICEGIQAADALHRATGEAIWEDWYRALWGHAARRWVTADGTWLHEVDDQWREGTVLWPGRPDFYHASGAYLEPLVGPAPFLAAALAGRA